MKDPLVNKFTDNKADVNQGTDAPSILLAKKTAPSCYAVAGALADLIIAAGGDVAAEALLRSNADSAEATLRSNADIAEASARNTAIGNEVTARNGAISSAIGTEVTNRNTAINSAIGTEVTNRNTAIVNASNAHVSPELDLNNLKTSGVWIANTTSFTNTPYHSANFAPLPASLSAYISVVQYPTSSVKQIWMDYGNGDKNRIFERDYNYTTSTWTAWTDNNSLYGSTFSSDLNTLKASGTYYVANTATNIPSAALGFLAVFAFGTNIKQVWYEQNPVATVLGAYQRCIDSNNVWGAWMSIGLTSLAVTTIANTAVSNHVAAINPHSQYMTVAYGVGFPNYNAGVSLGVNTTVTITTAGWLHAALTGYDGSSATLTINSVAFYVLSGTNYDGRASVEVPVKVGDVITTTTRITLTLFPFRA